MKKKVHSTFFRWSKPKEGYEIQYEYDLDRINDEEHLRITFGNERFQETKKERKKIPFIVERLQNDTMLINDTILDENPGLFLEFAKLKEENDFLCFANKFGRLLPKDFDSQVDGEKVQFWAQQVALVRRTLKVWLLQSRKNWPAIDGFTTKGDYGIRHNPDKTHSYTILQRAHPIMFNRFQEKGYTFLPAKMFVQQRINKQLEKYHVNPHLLFNDENNLEQYYIPSSLLSALWYQFSLYVAGRHQLRICQKCETVLPFQPSPRNTWEGLCEKCSNKKRQKEFRRKT